MEWLTLGLDLSIFAGHRGGVEGSCRLQARKTPRRGTPQALKQGLRHPLAMGHRSSKIRVEGL